MFDQLESTEISRELRDTYLPDFAKMKEVQEFAPNMEVQAEEIRDVFCEIPELSFENWKTMDVGERAAVLTQFEQKIAQIEMRPSFPVVHEATRPGLMGYYDGTKLVISDNLLGSNEYADYKETLDTLFHEGRHAYQFYNMDVARTEQSDELINAWHTNLKDIGYLSSDLFGFELYYTQPVEVDARVFAETVIKTIGV